MVITGSALFVEAGSAVKVIERLKLYDEVTFQVSSDSETELVVNLEAEDLDELENLCVRLKKDIREIVDITHIYVNFEEEVRKAESQEAGEQQ
jgi:type II secretory pathway component GspD/PulD (secretin)